MKVILKENVAKLGKSGDIVNVADGYARNFLIPRDRAVLANEHNVKYVEHQKKLIQSKVDKEKQDASRVAELISAHSCTLARKVTEDEEKLFGSVTAADIAEVLTNDGYDIDKNNILLEEPIRTLGVKTVEIKIAENILAKLKVWIVKE